MVDSHLTSSIRGVSGLETIKNIKTLQASNLQGDTLTVKSAAITTLTVINASITVASIERYRVVNATITNASIQKLRGVSASLTNASIQKAKIINASMNNATIFDAKILIPRSKIVSTKIDFTATPSDNTIMIGGVVTATIIITLPYATLPNQGVNITVFNNSTFLAIIKPRAGDTIEGAASIHMHGQYDKTTVMVATPILWVEK